MSVDVFEPVSVAELFEGWTVTGSGLPRMTVERREGELVLVSASSPWAIPVEAFADTPLFRVQVALPTEPGLYVSDDPDHEVVRLLPELGWQATDVTGSPLEEWQVRELGPLVHHVPASMAAELAVQAIAAQRSQALVQLDRAAADVREAREAVAEAHAAGRDAALAEVWSFLRERGPWWRPVRRAVARHLGRSLVGGGS